MGGGEGGGSGFGGARIVVLRGEGRERRVGLGRAKARAVVRMKKRVGRDEEKWVRIIVVAEGGVFRCSLSSFLPSSEGGLAKGYIAHTSYVCSLTN